MRRSDRAARWEYNRPAGVLSLFHLNEKSVEPAHANRCANLLSKADCRAALLDEPKPHRSEMAVVGMTLTLSCCGEGLARERGCPNRSVIGDAGEAQGVAPDPDPGEEVALGESAQVFRLDIDDAALIDFPVGYVSGGDQVPQPLGGERVEFVA